MVAKRLYRAPNLVGEDGAVVQEDWCQAREIGRERRSIILEQVEDGIERVQLAQERVNLCARLPDVAEEAMELQRSLGYRIAGSEAVCCDGSAA